MATTTVQDGDTLGKIASRTHIKQDELFAANRGVIGSNPANLVPGTILEIPEATSAAGSDDDDEEGED